MSKQYICDGCKKPVSKSIEVKVGFKKFDVCDLCKKRLLDFFAKPESIMNKVGSMFGNA